MTELDFAKSDGLLPVIAQDVSTKQVLMLGFMNQEAYELTLRSGYLTFWSRTRQALWTKGETSGNRLHVKELAVDCDNDTLLAQVHIEGDGVCCHTGAKSCFFTPVDINDR